MRFKDKGCMDSSINIFSSNNNVLANLLILKSPMPSDFLENFRDKSVIKLTKL